MDMTQRQRHKFSFNIFVFGSGKMLENLIPEYTLNGLKLMPSISPAKIKVKCLFKLPKKPGIMKFLCPHKMNTNFKQTFSLMKTRPAKSRHDWLSNDILNFWSCYRSLRKWHVDLLAVLIICFIFSDNLTIIAQILSFYLNWAVLQVFRCFMSATLTRVRCASPNNCESYWTWDFVIITETRRQIRPIKDGFELWKLNDSNFWCY